VQCILVWPAVLLFHSVNSEDLYISHNCTQELAATYSSHCLLQTGSHEPHNKTSVLHTFGLRNTEALLHAFGLHNTEAMLHTFGLRNTEALLHTFGQRSTEALLHTFGLRNTEAL
jgi:hypothetical protein